ncbi:MAG: lysozyme inhibitor LprI family protein [Pseudomonadota bacterium]
MNATVTRMSFVALAWVMLALPVSAQFYDKAAAREAACAKERTKAEQEICLDRGLTRHDAALNEVYADLRKLMPRDDFAQLRREQRGWLKQRNRCGANNRCLSDIYVDRLAELEQMAENLSNPGKSHVEIGCDGPGQVYRNGQCETVSQGLDEASDLVWGVTGGNDPTNRGRYTVRLRNQIPETDAIAFEAVCDAGSSGTFASTTIGYNTQGRAEGATIGSTLTVDGKPFRYSAAYYGTQAEFGVSGLLVYPDFEDPFWEAMAAGRSLLIKADDGAATAISLRGSGGPVREFIQQCKDISTDNRYAQKTPRPTTSRPSCEAFGTLKSKRSDTPVTVTFVNRTESYRSVMWLNFEGRPIEYANLNAGQSFTVNTYLTHPWMFTDGPGNCIELYVPKRGEPVFEVRTPSPAFGPGND